MSSRSLGTASALALAIAVIPSTGAGQSGPPPGQDPVAAVQREVNELRLAVNELREELAASRRETQALREQMWTAGVVPASKSESAAGSHVETPAETAEDEQLIAARVNEQEQTKVSSGSRYHVQLSGMALFNAFSNRGVVDNVDLPGIARLRGAMDAAGTFGASARQTQLTLQVFGPVLGGARTSGEVTADFFGGFPSTPEGVTAGLMRLRTARLAFDWKDTSLVVGQETPFFSPLSPTSLVSTAYPALAGAGNIWTWTPQVYVDHRIRLSGGSAFVLEGGLLDPLTGEISTSEYNRVPTAGESSRNPAWAARFGWQGTRDQKTAALGVGGYFSRQNWGFGRGVDAWVATADWDLPLGRWFAFSGEVYRGQAIAGLGGGEAPSAFFSGPPSAPSSGVAPAASAGGWVQLKFQPVERFEFNTAFGEDQVLHSSLFRFPLLDTGTAPIRRNESGFVNIIYRPRMNLLFSLEYRRLWTIQLGAGEAKASQIGAAAGVSF